LIVAKPADSTAVDSNVFKCNRIFGLRGINAHIEPRHLHVFHIVRARAKALHINANRAAAREITNGYISNTSDVATNKVDADGTRVAFADIDSDVFNEIHVGIIAFTQVDIIFATKLTCSDDIRGGSSG